MEDLTSEVTPQSHFPPSENRTQSPQRHGETRSEAHQEDDELAARSPRTSPGQKKSKSPPRTRSTGRQITSTLQRKKRQRNDR